MIDLHCHLLPGIDDGPENLAQALDLARLAVARGVCHAVVTPHVHPGCWNNEKLGIEQAWRSFRDELAQQGIPLALGMAAEARLCVELIALLREDRIPFLGMYKGKRVLLLEFPHEKIPFGSDGLVRWLLKRDILPMIAHPERNKAVIRNFASLYPFVKLGCLFQVTAGSLAGQFGAPAEERAHQMLEKDWISVLASDAHNVHFRPPNLDEGWAAAVRSVGEDDAHRLVYGLPAEILGLPDIRGADRMVG